VAVITNHQLALASSDKELKLQVIFHLVLPFILIAILTLPEAVVTLVVSVQVFQAVCNTQSSSKVHHVPSVQSLAEFSNLG
jgi:hypothetical protein